MGPISFCSDIENSFLNRSKHTESHFVINFLDYVVWLAVPTESENQTSYDMNRLLLFDTAFFLQLSWIFCLFVFLKSVLKANLKSNLIIFIVILFNRYKFKQRKSHCSNTKFVVTEKNI